MEAEEDDLSALRSAALASLSAKPKPAKKEEEDDLEALRLAALMTRKRNQKIEVIYQQPVQQIPQFQPPPIFPNVRPPWIPIQRPHGPPWLLQRPAWRVPMPAPSTNLISLTPGPNTGMPRPRQRFSRPQNYSARAPRPPVARVETASESAAVENKVPDKFSRYNSDSSSDEDEDNDKKKAAQSDDENNSDAESVTSKKSFSSVSDVEEGEEKEGEVEEQVEPKEDAKNDVEDDDVDEEVADEARSASESGDEQDPEIANDNDDNISIIDDGEDYLLAAIDDFLEDRPVKPKATKGNQLEVKKEEKAVEKPKTIAKKKRESVDKRPKAATKRKSSVAQKATSSSKEKPVAPKPDSIKATRQQPSLDTSVPKVVAAPDISNQKPQNRMRESQKPDSTNPRVPPPQRDWSAGRPEGRQEAHSRRGGFPAQYRPEGHAPPQRLLLPPSTPPRQRRDSDLDSVGTSDLSFLASDSDDDERKKLSVDNQKPNRVRTRSMSGEGKKREQQTSSGKRVETKTTGQSRKNDQSVKDQRKTKRTADAPKERLDARRRLGQKDVSADLRKKLESKGISKFPAAADSEKDSPRTDDRGGKTKAAPVAVTKNAARGITARSLSPVRKSGVINLKKKSSRFPAPAESKSNRSREVSPDISLPDLSEARRIVITRPNTSSSKATIKLEQAQQHPRSKARIDSKHTTANKPKRPLDSDQQTRKEIINEEAEGTLRVNRKRNVLPPRTSLLEKRPKTREKIVEKSPEPEMSSEEEESGSGEGEDDSSSEEEIIDEVFAIDDSALPAYDDVLGNVDDEDGGEYYDGSAKNRKRSQSSSKKRKRSEKRKGRSRSRKSVPDSRRIVPKSSPERVSEQEVEDRHSAKTAQPKKKTIHERLGMLAGGAARKAQSPPKQSSKARRWSGSSAESSRSSMRWSDDEFEVEHRSDNVERFLKKHQPGKSGSSSVKIAGRKETRAPEATARPSPEEKDSKKRKRRIMVAGRREVEESIPADPKAKRAGKKSRGPNVKDRLGKVILTSVLNQSPPERGRERAVKNVGVPTTEVREKVKRNRKERDRSKSGSKRGKREDVLEAKIRRIKEQNGQILKRQKEIEMEKERFG